MRHLSALTVEATFDGPVPDLSGVPGVSSVEVDGSMVRCQVRGSIEPLLKVLAAAGVTELLSREPSLEELFLAQYGADGRAADLGIRAPRSSAPVRAGGIAGHRRRRLDRPQGGPLGGPVGLHLRRRHRLVGDQLRRIYKTPAQREAPWPPPTARTRR